MSDTALIVMVLAMVAVAAVPIYLYARKHDNWTKVARDLGLTEMPARIDEYRTIVKGVDGKHEGFWLTATSTSQIVSQDRNGRDIRRHTLDISAQDGGLPDISESLARALTAPDGDEWRYIDSAWKGVANGGSSVVAQKRLLVALALAKRVAAAAKDMPAAVARTLETPGLKGEHYQPAVRALLESSPEQYDKILAIARADASGIKLLSLARAQRSPALLLEVAAGTSGARDIAADELASDYDKTPEAVSALDAQLKRVATVGPKHRERLAMGLRRVPHPEREAALLRLLDDDFDEVRVVAAEALRDTGTSAVLPEIAKIAERRSGTLGHILESAVERIRERSTGAA